MTDHTAQKARIALAKAQISAAQMSTDRPLDALFPELTAPAGKLPKRDLHPRIIEAKRDDGLEWMMILWRDPGVAESLHRQIKELLEATLLAELSRPATQVLKDGVRHFRRVQLLVMQSVRFPLERPLQAFGFQKTAEAIELQGDSLAVLSNEAQRSGHVIPTHVAELWTAQISHPPGALGEKLNEIEVMMAGRLGEDVWGAAPGKPSLVLSSFVDHLFGQEILPTLQGLQTLEMLLVQQEVDHIRWMPSLCFQALCDFIGVVASRELKQTVQWAECSELEDGLHQPPLFRHEIKDTPPVFIPIGEHVLRWCMMPIRAGEEIPSLAEWLLDQFANT